MQKEYYFALKSGANVDIDISSLSNSDEITISASYGNITAGITYASERVTVSTAKGWSEHELLPQANVGAKITYSNGNLVFSGYNTTGTWNVVVWVIFNN